MTKKKLPKVILSLNDEAHPATSPGIPSAAGQQSSAAHNGVHDRTVSERPSQATDNVVRLISPYGEERASGGRHPAENDYDPLQSPYPPKEEPAPPRIEENFAAEATPGQQELVRSVQREEAAAQLPRAAQLPSVLGLAPGDEGLWPARSLEPEYRDNLRGPRTIIKTIFLIVSIFTVPIAYYFWMGGWDTISGAPPPEVASFNSRPFIPPPKPSSEEETTTVRGGDPGTPAKGERRTAKSSAGETVAMLQPGTPAAQDSHSSTAIRALDLPKPSAQQGTTTARGGDLRTPAKTEPQTPKSSVGETAAMLERGTPGAREFRNSSTAARAPKPLSQQETTPNDLRPPANAELRTAKSSAGEAVAMLQPGTPSAQAPLSSPAVRALDAEQIKLLMKQGEQFIAAGDVVTARTAFQRAAEAGDAKAAVALGATYDPTVLAKLGIVGISADVAKARSWTTTARGGDLRTPAKTEPQTPKSSVGETAAMLERGTPGAREFRNSSTAARAPKPLSQQETTPNDLRPPANAELRTAKSSAGEAVAMLQPGTPSAQAPLSSPAVRALDAEQIKLLMKQGEQFIAAGDVVTARTAFQRAAEAGDAKAAVALGATYDPTVLAKLGVVGISADVAKARSWYQKAEKLGSPDARQRLELLADR